MAQNERENFYRNSTVIVDHGKEVLGALLDNELSNHNIIFPDLINQYQHDIYHLCFNRNPCCLCKNGLLPKHVPKNRVLQENQLDLLFDRSVQKLPGHNGKSWSNFCCLPAKQTVTIDQLDVTLTRCMLINFSTVCTAGSSIRTAVDKLIGYRNKLYGHVEVARISDIEYNLFRPQIECCILDIAKFCNIEDVMKQKLQDAYRRPLDQTLCSQYQNILLDEIRRAEKLEFEIKSHLSSTECRMHEHLDTICLTIGNKVENINLHFNQQNAKLHSIEGNLKTEILEERSNFEVTMNKHLICLEDIDKRVEKNSVHCEQLGAKLQSIESNLKTEILEKQNKFEMTMLENRQILEDTKKSFYDNVWKTESVITRQIHETATSLENKIDDYQTQTEQQVQNLKHTVDVTISDLRIKHGTSDQRKDNLIAHTNARLQYHTNDKTFVRTNAVSFAEEMLEKHKILVLLGKAGSGKSTISLHVASTYKEKGFVPLLFIDKDIIQYRDLISINQKTLVVVEDLFGRSNVQFEDNLHTNILDVLVSLTSSPNMRLIITIRNSPICKKTILQKHDIFKGDCTMDLDSDWSLSDKEKISIFLRHMEHNSIRKCAHPLNIDVCLDYDLIPPCLSCKEAVVELPGGDITVCTDLIYLVCSSDTYIGYPETCRMFCSNKRFTLLGVDYFRRTPQSLLYTLNELFTNGFADLKARYQYCLLVYTAMHNGILNFSEINKNFENDVLLVSLFSIFDNGNVQLSRICVQHALKELDGTYLIKGSEFNDVCVNGTQLLKEDAYFFKHQSIFEAVLISFGTECPKQLLNLEICDIDFIMSYIRPKYVNCRDVCTPVLFVDSDVLLTKLFNILKVEKVTRLLRQNGDIHGIIPFDSKVSTGDEMKLENLVKSKHDILNSSNNCNVQEENEWSENITANNDKARLTGNGYEKKCLLDSNLGFITYKDKESSKNIVRNEWQPVDEETLDLRIPKENLSITGNLFAKNVFGLGFSEFMGRIGFGSDQNDVNMDECVISDESENEEVEKEIWTKMDGTVLYRYWCKDTEKVGMFIRTCIMESQHDSFVKDFLERLPISSLVPDQITDILNGLTRHGTCGLSLQLKTDKLKKYILDYGTVKICCHLLRPKSSNMMSEEYYQIDNGTLKDKLFAFINNAVDYESVADIGKFLLTISAEEGYATFVNDFLTEAIIRLSANNPQKLTHFIDGFCDKGNCKNIVQHLSSFLKLNLVKYGSINTVLGICSLKSSRNGNMCSIGITRQNLLKTLYEHFYHKIIFSTVHKNRKSFKTQTQELGSSLYEFGIKIDDDNFIEELLSSIIKCYDIYLVFVRNLYCHFNIPFLFYFTDGFTECGNRLNSAKKRYPQSMDLLEAYCSCYKMFEQSVRNHVKEDKRGNIWARQNIIYHVIHMDKLKPNKRDSNASNI